MPACGMAVLRVLVAVVMLGGVARAQLGTPPPCGGLVKDRERFDVKGRTVKFHLRFHTADGTFDARSVIKLPSGAASDATCPKGDALDYVISELVKERQQFLNP